MIASEPKADADSVVLPGPFGGHPGPVLALAFSPDSRLLASGGWDGAVRLWSAETGASISVLTGHVGSVLALGFTPDGDTVVSVGRDRTIRHWSITFGTRTVIEIARPRMRITGAWIGISESAVTVAVLGADAVLHVFDGRNGDGLAVHEDVSGVAFSSSGQSAVISQDGVITRGGGSWATGIANVEAAAFSFDQTRVFVAGDDRLVADAVAPEGPVPDKLGLELAPFTCLAGHPDGMLAGFADGSVEILDGDLSHRCKRPNGSPVRAVQCAPDGRNFAVASDDGRIGIFPRAAARPQERAVVWCVGHRSEILSVAQAKDGSWLATGDVRGEIRIWGRLGELEQVIQAGPGRVEWLAVSPLGAELGAVVGHHVYVWSVGRGFARIARREAASGTVRAGFADTVLCYSDGAAVYEWDGLLDAERVRQLGPAGQFGEFRALAVRHTGETVLAFENAVMPEWIRGSPFGIREACAVAVDPLSDGVFAVGTRRGSIAIVNSGNAPFQDVHSGPINALVYAPVATMLASCGDDGTIVLSWSGTLDPIRTLTGHLGAVRDASFSSDGERLVSVGDDGRILEWDVQTGLVLRGTGLSDQSMPQVPGLRNDSPSAVDLLERTDDVRTLATLIAAAGTRPPLAIALLGEWGSGKSSVLLQVHDMVAGLARYSRVLPGGSLFAANVRQVQFNAWHYSDDQVWTGLVDHLFRALADAADTDGADASAEPPDAAEVERARVELEQRLSAQRGELAQLEERSLTAGPAADVLAAARRGKAQLVVAATFAAVAVGGRVAIRWVLAQFGATMDTARRGWEQGRKLTEAAAEVSGSLEEEITRARQDVAVLEDRLAQISAAARLGQVLRTQGDPGAYADARGMVGRVHGALRELDEALRALRTEHGAGGAGSQPPLERIVLYIDDLDRCPPERVVQVLAAVHLMLALPLFVVVVAIDPLWLLNALEAHYGSVLSDAGEGEPHARALDYLDKIFQIPYVITAPSAQAMGEYLRTLLAAETGAFAEVASAVEPARRLASREPVAHAEHEAAAESPGQSAPAAQMIQGADFRVEATVQAPSPTAVAPTPATLPNLRPGGLLLRPAEADFMARLAPLVGTPRAGKKLANLYRLVRIRIPESELREFILGEDYRRVQILLAILVGEPAAAPAVFAAIRAAQPGEPLFTAVREGRPEAVCRAVAGKLWQILGSWSDEPVEAAAFQRWCALLERYSFHTLRP